MPNPTIRIHNLETNEVIDREMTDAEYEVYLAEKAAESAKQEEKAVIAAAKAAAEAKLKALGLTTQDLKALGL